MKANGNPTIVERYSLLDRVVHIVHAAAMLALIITGLKMYFGWNFMSFHTAALSICSQFLSYLW